MKKLYMTVYAIILVCIIGSAWLIAILPDVVPVHYNLAGEVNRFGSKYEYLLFPAISVAFGAFFVIFAKKQGKGEDTASEKPLLYVAIVTLIFFTAMTFYFMVKAMCYRGELSTSAADIMKFVGTGIGGLLVFLGAMMPKVKRNSLFGLRTKWSMSSDKVWLKSQRFGGMAAVICGAVMVAISLLVPGMKSILIGLVLVILWGIICSAASYHYYKREIEKDCPSK